MSVDYIGFWPTLSTSALPAFLDTEPPVTPSTSPRFAKFSRYAGVKLGPAGLHRSLAAVDGTRVRPHSAGSGRRPGDTWTTPETPRSVVAGRDRAPVTGKDTALSDSGPGMPSRLMSPRLKHRRGTSADGITALRSLAAPTIHKVSVCVVDVINVRGEKN